MPNEIDELKRSISELERQLREHTHNGFLGGQVSIQNLTDFIQVVDAAPTHTPRSFWDSVKIYNTGAVYRFYWYDNVNTEWRYSTGA
jgi:uncharacterized protein YcfL